MTPMGMSRRATIGLAAVSGVILAGASARADVILHEYFRPDPVEDLQLAATTSDGALSAAIQTQSGAVAAPVLDEPDLAGSGTYGGDRAGSAPGGTERLDSDTTQPAAIDYSDPFTPEIMPFKREFAFDTVTDGFELGVFDASLSPVEIGGEARIDDDQFYADLRVMLSREQPVRIPTVGPGTRVLGLRTEPPVAVEVLRDGADNWFLQAAESKSVRVTMQLAIDRAVFGSPFAPVAWSRLGRYLPTLPPEVRESGRRVADTIGITSAMTPGAALEKLVGHFRSFSPSGDRPSSAGARLFEEIVLSQKGVCRHRSFGFVVTALSVGLPARFVRNEAHAWVEVFDATRWHRVDLGGAAGRVDANLGDRPPHVTPRDPYRWPPGSDSGAAMADRARDALGGGALGRSATSAPGAMPPDRGLDLLGAGDDVVAVDRVGPPSEVTLSVKNQSAVRGGYLPVSGEVSADGERCAFVRVDFELRPSAGSGRTDVLRLGTLFTDAEGRYEHRVVVPFDIEVGDYEVVASTPGGAGCGQGASR
jgi:hypothetical protein